MTFLIPFLVWNPDLMPSGVTYTMQLTSFTHLLLAVNAFWRATAAQGVGGGQRTMGT